MYFLIFVIIKNFHYPRLPLYFVHLYSVCGTGLGLKLPFEAELMIKREVIMDLTSFTTLLLSVRNQIKDCTKIIIRCLGKFKKRNKTKSLESCNVLIHRKLLDKLGKLIKESQLTRKVDR